MATASRVAARAFDRPIQAVGLSGLPRTALPNDLRRLCGKHNIENVAHVALEYKRFRPTGSATIVFTRPEFLHGALKTLDKATLAGKRLKTYPISSLPDPTRTRGSQGILEAGQRGSIKGNGPDAGIAGGGKNVVIYGLPGKIHPNTLSETLRDFKVVGMEQGRPVVIKLPSDKAASFTSRFLVRLGSVSEAYRLVRTLHMQKWRPESFGDRFIIRAAIVS